MDAGRCWLPTHGKHSSGVKRPVLGKLGKIGNCQIGVSLHAVCERAPLPLGWALYLPEDWCDDPERRRKAKIPAHVVFQTKPPLDSPYPPMAAQELVRSRGDSLVTHRAATSS